MGASGLRPSHPRTCRERMALDVARWRARHPAAGGGWASAWGGNLAKRGRLPACARLGTAAWKVEPRNGRIAKRLALLVRAPRPRCWREDGWHPMDEGWPGSKEV